MNVDPSNSLAAMDKRTLSRMLMRGDMTTADLKAELAKLPDLADCAEFCEVSWERPRRVRQSVETE